MHIQKFLKQMFLKPIQKGFGINGFYLTYQLKQQPRYHCVTVSTEAPDKQVHLFPFITASLLKNFVLLKRSITHIQCNSRSCAYKVKNEACFTIQKPKALRQLQNQFFSVNKRNVFCQGQNCTLSELSYFA